MVHASVSKSKLYPPGNESISPSSWQFESIWVCPFYQVGYGFVPARVTQKRQKEILFLVMVGQMSLESEMESSLGCTTFCFVSHCQKSVRAHNFDPNLWWLTATSNLHTTFPIPSSIHQKYWRGWSQLLFGGGSLKTVAGNVFRICWLPPRPLSELPKPANLQTKKQMITNLLGKVDALFYVMSAGIMLTKPPPLGAGQWPHAAYWHAALPHVFTTVLWLQWLDFRWVCGASTQQQSCSNLPLDHARETLREKDVSDG